MDARKKNEWTKAVYIVLSRSKSILSGAIHLVMNDQYTHAAIALDAGLEYMFSFGRRKRYNPFVGCFKHECLNSDFYIRYSDLPGVVLEIPVNETQYANITSDIWAFLLDGHTYDYNILGMFNIARGHEGALSKKSFFCSEFVYYILHKNGICDFGTSRAFIRPQSLLGVTSNRIFEGNLLEYAGLSRIQKAAPAYCAEREDLIALFDIKS